MKSHKTNTADSSTRCVYGTSTVICINYINDH